MLTRIVKLKFKPEHISDFETLFHEVEGYIRDYEGFQSIELLQDMNDPSIFFTYSKWNSETDLNAYRESVFFTKVWAKVKLYFSEKPQVWSVQQKNG